MSIKLVEIELVGQDITADNTLISVDTTQLTTDATLYTIYDLRVAPRFFTQHIVLTLWNEIREEQTIFNLNAIDDRGYMLVRFIHTFLEGESYEATITNTNNKLIWRGKLYSTSQTDIENFTLNLPVNNIIEI